MALISEVKTWWENHECNVKNSVDILHVSMILVAQSSLECRANAEVSQETSLVCWAVLCRVSKSSNILNCQIVFYRRLY